jgi:FkbM family methyltransferase
VSWDDGWVHRYRGGTVVWPTIGAPTPRQLHDRALEVNLFGMQLSEGDTVFDVGSGVGQEVLPFARIVGSSGTLVAIEAHPGTFRLLQQNIVRNHFDNVIAVNSAITDERKTVRIDGEVGGLGNRLTEVGGFSVPGTTIDDVMRNLGIQRVDFLKMNIEGAERDAVVGMEHTIDRTANVCIACHDFLVEETSDSTFATKALVADFLRSHGFVVTMRPDDSRVWVRDRVYGRRAAELPGCTT